MKSVACYFDLKAIPDNKKLTALIRNLDVRKRYVHGKASPHIHTGTDP